MGERKDIKVFSHRGLLYNAKIQKNQFQIMPSMVRRDK